MSTPPPKVSVLMAVYNGSGYLQEAIDSILSQTFTDFEFLIVEDASTDHTLQILQDYAHRDARIKLIQNEQNLGLTKSLNKALKLAQGDYVARQDADDIALPDRFAQQVAVLEQQPAVVLVSCDLELIDAEGNLLPHRIDRSCDSQLIPWYLLFCNYIAGHSQVMFRRQTVVELGGYCETYRYSQDYELWSRLIQKGEAVILPQPLQRQRMHNQSVSAQKHTEQQQYSLSRSQQNIADLLGNPLSLEEIADLRGLMMIPRYWYYFSDLLLPPARATALHLHLQQIYQAFIHHRQAEPHSDMAQKVRDLIGQQFLCWMQHLSIRKSWRLKLQVLLYALMWSPAQAVRTGWKKV